MEQIIITYNRHTSKITYQRLKNAPKEKVCPFNCPSKQPAILAFYSNRHNYLQRQKSVQSNYQGHIDSKESRKKPPQTQWLQILEDLVSKPPTNSHQINQKADQIVQIKQTDMAISELTERINSQNLIIDKSQTSQSETILQEQQATQIQSSFNQNKKVFGLHPNQNRASSQLRTSQTKLTNQGENSNQSPKIKNFSTTSQQKLNETLLKFIMNPLLFDLSLIELANLCIKINFHQNSLLNLQIESSNLHALFFGKVSIYQNIRVAEDYKKEEQEKLKQAIIILRSFFNLLDEFDSLTIIQSLERLISSQVTRVKREDSLQNESIENEECSFETEESIYCQSNKAPEVRRLIDILSLLESLKEGNSHND